MAGLSNWYKALALLGIFALSSVVGGGTYWLLDRTPSLPVIVSPISETVASPVASPITKTPPTAVRIRRIDLEVPVQAARVNGNDWDIFEDTAAWLATSAIAGEGNVILYAHDRPELFGNLYLLRSGDIVEVYQDNQWHSYTVEESKAITDSDIEAILSTQHRLTLYTCEGSFDEKRRVVYAYPQLDN